jgi:adenylate cyclase
VSETSETSPSGTSRVGHRGDGGWPPPLLLPVNPLSLLDLVMKSLVPRPGGPRLYSLEEAAARAGMAPDDVGRLWRALGFPESADGSPAYTAADIAAFADVARRADDGSIDLDLAISMARPMGHLLSRLGAAQVSALSGLLEPASTGRRSPSPPRTPAAGADALIPLLERLVVYAWRRHLTAAAAAAALPLGRLEASSAPQAVGFIDIASYTTLSRRIDWAQLASLLERFEEVAFDQVAAAGGRVVKTLGDEVLFVAAEPAAAAEIALSVMDAGEANTLPRVHAGLAYGPLLERAGDVFGPTVNIASRVTGLARAGAVLVDVSCRNALAADGRFRLQRRPRRPVRGYAHLATYRLGWADSPPAGRSEDVAE